MDLTSVSLELREKYLFVVGHGKRDDFSSMAEASSLVYEKIIETGSRYLLVDYRKLEINVGIVEAFNIVKRYEAKFPQLKDITIAVAFAMHNFPFANYWKEISEKRGFYIRIFDDLDVAETWLLKEISGKED
jgi:hypothetical protein